MTAHDYEIRKSLNPKCRNKLREKLFLKRKVAVVHDMLTYNTVMCNESSDSMMISFMSSHVMWEWVHGINTLRQES